MGSASELDYQLLFCRDLGFMKDDDFKNATSGLTEVRKMLTSFLISVEEQIDSKPAQLNSKHQRQTAEY